MNQKEITKKFISDKLLFSVDNALSGDKTSKTLRILELYDEFTKGHPVNKASLAQKYHVDERSIQRDIDEIRIFLSEVLADGKEDECKILYSKAEKCFRMEKNKSSKMSNSQILAVSKIILESRAFPVEEVNEILQKMVDSCVPAESMKLVQELIGNERFHYVGIQKESLQDKLWEIGLAIHEKNLLSIDYCKGSGKRDKIKRVVAPVSILFSEYYFYLNAFIMEKTKRGVIGESMISLLFSVWIGLKIIRNVKKALLNGAVSVLKRENSVKEYSLCMVEICNECSLNFTEKIRNLSRIDYLLQPLWRRERTISLSRQRFMERGF